MTKVQKEYLLAKMRLATLLELGPLKHYEEAERLRLLVVVERFERRHIL